MNPSRICATEPGGDDDTIHGLGNGDVIWGRAGNDRLIGGAGSNLLDGGEGDDFFVVRSATDTVVDSGGTDMIEAHVSFTLPTGVETLALKATGDIDGTGNADGNRLFGGDGANRLNGLGGNDLIIGGAGADTLVAGSGTDTLTGGTGADVFLYGALAESAAGASDRIRDFVSGTDILDFSAIGTEIGGWSATRFVIGAAFTGPKQVAWDAASGVLRVEGDGDAATVEFVLALRGASLVEGDIVFA
jgi:Ca2+-binding RTX toxin-like protein